MKRLVEYFLLMTALLFAGYANAEVTITFAQSGSDVVATATGTFTLPLNPQPFGNSARGRITPDQGIIIFAGSSSVPSNNIVCSPYTLNPNGFGSFAGFKYSSNNTGDIFGFHNFSNYVILPTNFTSGGPINSTVTFSNITLATLGLNSGNTVFTCGADTIKIVAPSTPPVSPSPEPIPTLSEWAQFIMMLMMIGTVGWYTRRMFR